MGERQKRREALERVLFYDILNTIGGIRGWDRLSMMQGSRAAYAAD